MKAKLRRFPKVGLTVLCILAILAAYIPFGLLLQPQAAGSAAYTRTEVDFEDGDLFNYSTSSALSIDGLPEQTGYLYGSNLSDTAQTVSVACPVTAGKTYTVSFDFLAGSAPAEGNVYFKTVVTDGDTTLSAADIKSSVYTNLSKWYHYEVEIAPQSADVSLDLIVSPSAVVVFDNMELIDADGKSTLLDGETAAGNSLYFSWVLKGSGSNPVFHINNPQKGGSTRYFAFNFNDGETSISKVLVANKKFKLRFNYYYVDNGYFDVASEKMKVLLSDKADNETGSLNAELDFGANDPKFGCWYTYETEFTAKNRKMTNLTFRVGAGIEMYIDNVEFVDDTGKTVLFVDFKQNYPVTVADSTPDTVYAIENGPIVETVDDWTLALKNTKPSPATAYVQDYDLKGLNTSKSYYLRMEAFVGRNAKDLIDNVANNKNFDVLIGNTVVKAVKFGDLTIDEWKTLKTDNFTPSGQWIGIRAYSGLTAYFDNIEIVDASTNSVVKTCKIDKVSGSGQKVDRHSVRAGMAKNSVLHINTPVRSKLDHVMDIRIYTPDLPDILQVGHEYKFTADLYYFDNGYTSVYDNGEMHNNMPTFRVGVGNGAYCEVFQNDRRTYMGKEHPYETWLKIKGGRYGQGLDSDTYATFTRMESNTKNNIYYTSMGVKVWCGTEVYVDNMAVLDAETNEVVYLIDFEDEVDYYCFDESVSQDAPVPKGSFVIEGGPEVSYDGAASATDYSVHASGNTVQILDADFARLKKDQDYRISFKYYMESAKDSGTLFQLYGIKTDSDKNYGLTAAVTADANRTVGRWEKAAFVGKLSDMVDGLALVAPAGTSVYVDDILITNVETAVEEVALAFTASSDVRTLSGTQIGADSKTPSKNKMVTVAEPKGLSMGYLRAVAPKSGSKSGKFGTTNGGVKLEPGCRYDVEFSYYQARSAAVDDTILSVDIDSTVAVSGQKNPVLMLKATKEREWTTAKFTFEVSETAKNIGDWMILNVPAGSAVYIDDLSVTKNLVDTNEEISLLDFEASDSTKYVTTGEGITRVTKDFVTENGFDDNGSYGYLYVDNLGKTSENVKFFEIKNVKLKDNTNYAVTIYFDSKKDTGSDYGVAVLTQNISSAASGGKTENYYNKIEKGWNSKTIYFKTGQVIPSANYIKIGVYGGQEFIFDNIMINEVIDPKPKKEAVLTFDAPDPIIYPSTNGFRQISNKEICEMYPDLKGTIGTSPGFLLGYSSDPRKDQALNYEIYGIALRSHSEYTINVQYMVLEFDTNPDDGQEFNHYCALGTNYGKKGSWNMKTFVSNIYDHKWRTMTLSIVTDEVDPGISYFVMPLYYGCAVLFDNFTVTEAANYDENLYCEDLYSQLENNDFESEVNESNWAPLADGMQVVADKGDTNRAANKHVLQIDGNALAGGKYIRSFPLINNTNYILSMWVKAEPDSDVTVGIYANEDGKNFKDLFLTEDGNLPFERDGKWHRVNMAFGSGIYDEGLLTITGTGGKIWIDDVDLYLASQGTSTPSTSNHQASELVYSSPLLDLVKPTQVVTKGQELTTETLYRTDTVLSTWIEKHTVKDKHKPQIGVRVRQITRKMGGEWTVGAYVCIVAIIIMVLSLAAFFTFLLLGKKKKENNGGAAQ